MSALAPILLLLAGAARAGDALAEDAAGEVAPGDALVEDAAGDALAEDAAGEGAPGEDSSEEAPGEDSSEEAPPAAEPPPAAVEEIHAAAPVEVPAAAPPPSPPPPSAGPPPGWRQVRGGASSGWQQASPGVAGGQPQGSARAEARAASGRLVAPAYQGTYVTAGLMGGAALAVGPTFVLPGSVVALDLGLGLRLGAGERFTAIPVALGGLLVGGGAATWHGAFVRGGLTWPGVDWTQSMVLGGYAFRGHAGNGTWIGVDLGFGWLLTDDLPGDYEPWPGMIALRLVMDIATSEAQRPRAPAAPTLSLP